jgi:hypothetical protein
LRTLETFEMKLAREDTTAAAQLVRAGKYHTKAFISDLAGRLQKRVQVSSDSLAAYACVIPWIVR